MPRPSHVVVGCLAAATATACAGATSTDTQPVAASPAPVRTVIRNTHVLRAGESVRIDAQRGVALRLTASRARVDRASLSSSHGYPPSHGYYVTFRLTVANVGRRAIGIGPGDFAVVVTGQGRMTSYDGNAPYSGASRQLDQTQLDPGQQVSAPLTFDVRRPHGRLGYYPDRTAAVVWRF